MCTIKTRLSKTRPISLKLEPKKKKEGRRRRKQADIKEIETLSPLLSQYLG
jgi:hypothetical protein